MKTSALKAQLLMLEAMRDAAQKQWQDYRSANPFTPIACALNGARNEFNADISKVRSLIKLRESPFDS